MGNTQKPTDPSRDTRKPGQTQPTTPRTGQTAKPGQQPGQYPPKTPGQR